MNIEDPVRVMLFPRPRGWRGEDASMHGQSSAEERREFYLSKAQEAEQRATQVKDLEARRMMTQIAESWRLLAQKIRDYPV
jgi:hypothetical protein